jgi:hypothetical protein
MMTYEIYNLGSVPMMIEKNNTKNENVRSPIAVIIMSMLRKDI